MEAACHHDILTKYPLNPCVPEILCGGVSFPIEWTSLLTFQWLDQTPITLSLMPMIKRLRLMHEWRETLVDENSQKIEAKPTLF